MKSNIEGKKLYYDDVISKLPIVKSSAGIFILYFLLSFILIGIILFSKSYISRKKATNNQLKREAYLADLYNEN